MKNQTSKYFKYAVGEIFLVVIGILIALQINNWNQNRLTKKTEYNYVNRLIKDLVSDTIMMARQIELSKISFHEGSMLDSMIREKSRHEIPAITIIDAAQSIGRIWLPQYNTNTYDDLLNTGNFNTISNPIVADRIRTHYTNLPVSWNDTFDQRNEELRRIMVELIPLKYHAALLETKSMPQQPDPKTVLSTTEANLIVHQIITYPKIDFYVKNVTRGHIFNIRLMDRLKNATTNLIKDLQNYNKE